MNAQQTELKNQLLEACYVKQQALIDDFKIRIKALLQVDGLGNEEEYDNNQQANVSQNITEADALNQELIFVNEEMKMLRKLEPLMSVKHNCVEFGAVVKTDKRTFFISTSIEEFVIDNKTFVGLSTKSALYSRMKGLRKGDDFSYHGVTYKIIDIF